MHVRVEWADAATRLLPTCGGTSESEQAMSLKALDRRYLMLRATYLLRIVEN